MLSVTDFDRKGTIAEKDSEEYAAVMAWIRCKLSFALLRSVQ